MRIGDRPTFDNRDREDIYRYLEHHGAAPPAKLRRLVDLAREPKVFNQHVRVLKREQILEERDGKLRLAVDSAGPEEFASDELTVVVRQAREEDLSALLGVIQQVIEEDTYVKAESVADLIDTDGLVLRQNHLESRIFFVATVRGEVVGWVHIDRRELEKVRHTGRVTLGVLPDYRNHGIGTYLLERSLHWGADRTIETVYVAIAGSNERARAFLESRDFVEVAVREDHYNINGDYVDEVMLARQVS